MISLILWNPIKQYKMDGFQFKWYQTQFIDIGKYISSIQSLDLGLK